MEENINKVLDELEGIKGFVREKVEEYSPENVAHACIDELNTLPEFLECDYLNMSHWWQQFSDHLTEIFLELNPENRDEI